MKVQVGGSAILAVVGIAAAAYVGYKVYRKGADAADAVAELWKLGGQKIEAFAEVAKEQGAIAATNPNSLPAVIAYGGPLNPIARTAASAAGAWDELQELWGRVTGGAAPENTQPAPWLTGNGAWNNPSAYTAPGTTGSGGAAFGIYPKP